MVGKFTLQLQTGLLVTGWDYMDYNSICRGLPLWLIRVEPIAEYQEAIMTAAELFEKSVREQMVTYADRIANCATVIETEREPEEQEVYLG